METNSSNLFQEENDIGIEKLIRYLKVLHENVSVLFDSKSPFLKGDFDFSYHEYLKDKVLNEDLLNDADGTLKYVSNLFQNTIKWHHPGTMYNIHPHPNLASLAVAFYSQLFNPNFASDLSSGLLMTSELEVVKYLSDLVDWDWESSGGIFTFGGKGTNLYATKIGLCKASPEVRAKGILNTEYFVISGEKGHPSHAEVCNWTGIGFDNCIRLPVNQNDIINAEEARKVISENLEKGKKLACINLNGGSTMEYAIDPIKDFAEMRDDIVKKYELDYTPHIHIDSVIGWCWLFFKTYDFNLNPLKITDTALKRIESMYRKISQVKYADSFGVDFHKTGFTSYVTSLFVAKNREDLDLTERQKTKDLKDLKYGDYNPFKNSLELSRSSAGALSALVALKTITPTGYQKNIKQLIENADYLRTSLLGLSNDFEVLNLQSEGFVTFIIIRPTWLKDSIDTMIDRGESEALLSVRNYNMDFYKLILERTKDRALSFFFSASKSYAYRDTVLNALKIYPMSLLANQDTIDEFIKDLISLKREYDKGVYEKNDGREIIDYMLNKEVAKI